MYHKYEDKDGTLFVKKNKKPKKKIRKIASLFLTKRMAIVALVIIISITGAYGLFYLAKSNQGFIVRKTVSAINSVSGLLSIQPDEKKEIEVMEKLVNAFTKSDGVERSFLILLQNNMELRPGGGFLGQYAIVTVLNGNVTSVYFEDANLLDQRIKTKVAAPYPLKRMMQIKNWKFRDSNFSPDFPTNADKAKYFMRLSGKATGFDGVIAVNAQVFDDVLKITGPITVPGYSQTFSYPDASLKLEEAVEKQYILRPELDTQNRKMIMKKMAPIIVQKLMTPGNVSAVASLIHDEFKKKNIMVNFTDPELQSLVESVFWDGKMATDWGGDYFMMVDANMGALKTDYYIKREISYDIDLTAEKPVVTARLHYKNTAPYGDWRTSDYHSYMRLYVPKGATLLEREMVNNITTGEEFGKTYFGFILHVLIGGETNAMVKYELPADFDRSNYRLLIQKQSGVGDVPVKVHVKTAGGEFDQEQTLSKDLKFEFQ